MPANLVFLLNPCVKDHNVRGNRPCFHVLQQWQQREALYEKDLHYRTQRPSEIFSSSAIWGSPKSLALLGYSSKSLGALKHLTHLET